MDLIRDAWFLYKENILKILLMGVVIVAPVYWIYLNVNILVYKHFLEQGGNLAGHFFDHITVVTSLIALAVVQLPFIQMALQDMEEGKATLGKAFGSFFKYVFPVFILSLIYVCMVIIGFTFLVIPGLIVLILFYLFPYAMVIEGKKGFQSFSRAFELGKSHFFPLCGYIIGFGIVDWVFNEVVSFILMQFPAGQFPFSGLAYILSHMLFSMLINPFYVFVLTINYTAWSVQ